MKADDCSVRCSAIAQFGLNADIPRLARSRRHDMLHNTYIRACGGSTREDLCQILLQDIHEAMRLQSRPLAADLLVVLDMIVGECERAPNEEIVAFRTARTPTPILGSEKAA